LQYISMRDGDFFCDLGNCYKLFGVKKRQFKIISLLQI
jgi:hypothetical protein